MTNITIPPEALEAARVAWLESASDYNRLDDSIRAACLAMLRAWPGAQDSGLTMGKHSTRIYILPLPTENTND